MMLRWFANLRNRGLAGRAVVLLTAVVLVYAAAAPILVAFRGRIAMFVAAAAAIPCLLGAGLALLIAEWLRGSKHVSAIAWAPIPLRTGVPLLCGLVVHLHGGPLAEAGFLYYLLIFYPVTLTVETILSLPTGLKTAAAAEVSPNAAR